MTIKERLNRLNELAGKYYLAAYVDEDDLIETLNYVKFVKRFFTKLHKNKDININLLVNHLIVLYNYFDNNYITKYLILSVSPEHMTYLKTILLYMKKITNKHPWFEGVPISYDFDYLLNEINGRNFE